MTPAEHYAEAERLLTGRYFDADAELGLPGYRADPDTFTVARATAHALLALFPAPVEIAMALDPQPRVWPQDHATDLTVVGEVLTEEPGPEVATVTDVDGYEWRQVDARWCHGEKYTLPWVRLAERYGPIRGSAS